MTRIDITLDTELATVTDAAALRALADVIDPTPNPPTSDPGPLPEFYLVRDSDGDLGVAQRGNTTRYLWTRTGDAKALLAQLQFGDDTWANLADRYGLRIQPNSNLREVTA